MLVVQANAVRIPGPPTGGADLVRRRATRGKIRDGGSLAPGRFAPSQSARLMGGGGARSEASGPGGNPVSGSPARSGGSAGGERSAGLPAVSSGRGRVPVLQGPGRCVRDRSGIPAAEPQAKRGDWSGEPDRCSLPRAPVTPNSYSSGSGSSLVPKTTKAIGNGTSVQSSTVFQVPSRLRTVRTMAK